MGMYQSRRNDDGKSRGWLKQALTAGEGSAPGKDPPSSAPASERSSRPEGVSSRVWALAQDWIDQGEVVLGERPWVNRAAFAQRLSDRIESSKEIRAWVGKRPGQRYDDKQRDKVNRLVSEMIRLFWNNLEVGEAEGSLSLLHVRFLRDYWDALLDRAHLNLQAAYIRQHGVPVEDRPRSISRSEVEQRRLKQALVAAKHDVRPPVEKRKEPLRKPLH